MIISCNSDVQTLKDTSDQNDLIIYKMTFDESLGLRGVQGIVFNSRGCFYFPTDSLLLLDSNFSTSKREIVNDEEVIGLHKILTEPTLEKITNSDYSENCGLTKNEFLIKVKSGKSFKEYSFNEVLQGNRGCNSEELLSISNAFKNLKNAFNQ